MLEDIRRAINARFYLVTRHADEEMAADRLQLADVAASIRNGEMIEEYPRDFPFPSCLVFGKSSEGEPIHSVWAYDQDKALAILVTVYRPDPGRWIDFRVRR